MAGQEQVAFRLGFFELLLEFLEGAFQGVDLKFLVVDLLAVA